MEEKKEELITERAGQKKLPPRPMPPRPPLMRKQIVVEGDVAKAQEPQKVVEEQKSKIEEKIPAQKSRLQKKERAEDDKTSLKPENHQEKAKKQKKAGDEKRASQRARKSFNKKKFWIIFSCVLVGIGLIVGLTFLIIANLPAKPLRTPSNLVIVQNGEISYAVCDKVDGATKYIFEIDNKKYDSKTPSLDLSKLSEPKQYSIKVYAYGEKRGSMSGASEKIIYDLRKILSTPIIRFKETGSSEICWAAIENATSYELLVNNQSKDLGNSLSFDLSTLGGGEYIVQIRAKSSNSAFVESAYSNSQQFQVYEQLSGICGRVLAGGKIEIGRVENASRYEVTINATTFGIAKFDEEKRIINLNDAGLAQNTVVTYFKIKAIGENFFVSNSAELDTTIYLA